GDASPNVGWRRPACITAPQVVAHPRTPLREHLENVPVSRLHRVEDLVDEGVRNCLMEEVAHRVHEDHPATLPADRLVQALWSQGQVEARLKRVARHTAKPLREAFRVAVVAAGRDLRAARDWIPRRIGPLDCALISHAAPLKFAPATV